jgi:hypothetical protein
METNPLKPVRFTIADYLRLEATANQRHEYRNGQIVAMESMQEYVLVSQSVPWINTFNRLGDGTWRFATFSGLDGRLRLSSVDVEIPLSEIYSGIQFPPDDDQMQLF